MSTPILATKLYIPPPRPQDVCRPRLIERLNEGLGQNYSFQNQGFGRKLTLISAPAGFGKTTLVSSWLDDFQVATAGHEKIRNPKSEIVNQAAWLSLDEGDNDLNHFLVYLIAALQTIAATVGEDLLAILQAPPPVPTEPILTALLNEITAIPNPFVLVLDDYHVIEAKPVDQVLTFLLEHLPPQMHLVIATREDPTLPLARLRAQGQLTELRAADLRFTPTEAASFLNRVMGLNLSATDIDALESRTEGWIAGLQLAALAMQGSISTQDHQDAGQKDVDHKNISNFIKSFTGSHRFVMDYLVEEVLHQQPESVQAFLLRTSILDRMCGPLCDAIIGSLEIRDWDGDGKAQIANNLQKRSDQSLPSANFPSQEILEYLERANLLVVPLDDKRQWYRYHHLFADVLQARLIKQARLMKAYPHQVAHLHRQACDWYDQNNLPPDAIRHALAAEDFERAADLIELAWSEIRRSCFQSPTWLGWVKALPDELVRPRPVLSVGYAWELLNFGEMEAAEIRMRDAERWLEPLPDVDQPLAASTPEMVVVNEAEFSSLRSSLATARGYQAQALGDVPSTEKYARRALALAPESDYYTRGIASSLLGLAHWTNGDLEAAQKCIADARESLQLAGNFLFALSTTFVLADIRLAQGHLHKAVNVYKQALQLATAQGESILQGTADLYLGLSELYHEQGDYENAKQHLHKSEALGQQVALPHWPYRLCFVQARIKQSQGDLNSTFDLLNEAERLYYSMPTPDVRPIAALKTRVWIKQGKLQEALTWVREQDLSIDDELSYLREFEHITLARVLIAQYRNTPVDSSIQEAIGLLERLLQAAEAGERLGSVIEILLLQALARQAQDDTSAAIAPLQRALTLAAPEGYVRLFIDEGPLMASLLSEAITRGVVPDYTSSLLAAIPKFSAISTTQSTMIEPLSQRELEVLNLVAQGLSNREISERLFLALSTVKTHNQKIFGKLQVQRRTEAVARARELGLL